MVADLMNNILKDLEKYLPVEDLHTDGNHSCHIAFTDGFDVQIELDPAGENICVGTSLGVIPPGRYRHSLFKGALRANGFPSPSTGIFAFSEQTHSLILFQYLPAKETTGEKLHNFLIPFKEKALEWKIAIAKGDTPQVASPTSKGIKGTGMFGL